MSDDRQPMPLFGEGDTTDVDVDVRSWMQCDEGHLHVEFTVGIDGAVFHEPDGIAVTVYPDGATKADAVIGKHLRAKLLTDHRLEHLVSLTAINKALLIYHQEVNR